MNAPHHEEPSCADDRALRASLRDALARAPEHDVRALEARALEQWRLRGTRAAPPGPLVALHARWRQHPALWGGTALVLGAIGVMLVRSWFAVDPGIDELMQPDVLSLMTMGVL